MNCPACGHDDIAYTYEVNQKTGVHHDYFECQKCNHRWSPPQKEGTQQDETPDA